MTQAWQVQRGVAAIPKSITPERIQVSCAGRMAALQCLQANYAVWDFALDAEDMARLDALNNGTRYCVPKLQLVPPLCMRPAPHGSQADGTEVPRDGAHKYYPFHIEF